MIRRAKKRKYIVNDTRINACLRRFDDNVYTRLEFLKAVSPSMGAHGCDLYTESTDDYCEVCLVAQREPRRALVPCGHRRYCEACIRHLERIGSSCPVCRVGINMVLRLF